MKLTSREQRLAAVTLGAGRASHSSPFARSGQRLVWGRWRRAAWGD
jgi:hypothetical protein